MKKKNEFLIVISFCDLKDHGLCVKILFGNNEITLSTVFIVNN